MISTGMDEEMTQHKQINSTMQTENITILSNSQAYINNENHLFVGKVNSIRSLVTILTPLSFKSRVFCVINAQGLCFIAEDSKALQAKAYVPYQLFREFQLTASHEISFVVDIGILLDCLNIFGSITPVSGIKSNDTPSTQRFISRNEYNDSEWNQIRPLIPDTSRGNVTARISYSAEGGELTLL